MPPTVTPLNTDRHARPVDWYQGDTLSAPPELTHFVYHWLYVDPATMVATFGYDGVWVNGIASLRILLEFWNGKSTNWIYYLKG